MKNMGKIDRIIRFLAGLLLIISAFIFQGVWWLGIIGAVLILTSAIAICPAYFPLKISTIKKDKK